MEDNSTNQEVDAFGMHIYAQKFMTATEKMLSDRVLCLGFGPFYYLASHSFELNLKSVLIHSEYTEEDLRKVGHDLKKLFIACETCGFVFDEKDQRMAEVFKNCNKYQMCRYPKIGTFPIGAHEDADPKKITVYLNGLFKKVGDFIST